MYTSSQAHALLNTILTLCSYPCMCLPLAGGLRLANLESDIVDFPYCKLSQTSTSQLQNNFCKR